ncbi:unnamed protein product [Spirodela intermedia]|uniref:DNA 3'-5' helicase n=1 Tax=Spirodela intermedia TaxID=51605 RepID=A0A7I8IVR0_SPIIN|nr:unnamed protein product [Spirodela intermedia]CAA6661239.1 unnamed protein product [Spirodela intermedia]
MSNLYVSVFMDNDGVEKLEEYRMSPGRLVPDTKHFVDEIDIALSCTRFPCITLGNSPLVELYGGVLYEEAEMNLLASKTGREYRYSGNVVFTEHENSEERPLLESTHSDATFSPKPFTEKSISKPAEISSDSESILDKPIKFLPGLSSRCCRQLENSGFHTVRKLLHHFPRTYADLQNSRDAIDDGQYLIFVGTVLASRGIKASISFSFVEVLVGCEFADGNHNFDDSNKDHSSKQNRIVYLHLKKYFRGTRFTNQSFLRSLQSKYKEGDHVCVSGKVKKLQTEDHYEMREYSIDILDEDGGSNPHAERRPYPLYPAKAGLKPGFLRDIISRALKVVERDIDPIPRMVLSEFNLVDLRDAYIGIHHPRDLDEADSARRRLIFDDFFTYRYFCIPIMRESFGNSSSFLGRLFQMLEALGTQIEKEDLLDKYRRQGLNTISNDDWCSADAASEIIWDLKRPVPMNRLLQRSYWYSGDVGCGKTVVAFLACMEVIGSGFQAAFMVPTELLATQHYEHLLSLLENIKDVDKPSIAILTGSTASKQSRIIRQGLQSGEIDMVIGTHSLIAEKVEFSALRIAVVDEQQRFGVIQRGRFNSKQLYYASEASKINAKESDESANRLYMAPHILAMSATPIPRTLALALYGDMTLTQITDLPPGRLPIDTHVLQSDEGGLENVYKMMLEELHDGGKVYLVYPIIDESEQLPQLRAAAAEFESISDRFNGYQCGLLHGRMKSDEKDHTLQQFRSGEVRILLSTQVIEIGVDVPDASMMVVMNAERFGISQLHQLRGRVGRGERKSRCVLLSSTASSVARLKVLEKSCDGFYLANADLILRGPGNLLGKKQSGHLPEFPIARLEIDGSILQEAHLAALSVLGTSNDLQSFPRLRAELSMRQPLCLLGD